MSYALMNSYNKVLEERDKFKQHSIILNKYIWNLSMALGKISPESTSMNIDDDYPDKLLQEVLEKLK